jgi:uncharacterized membrane protein
VPDEIMGLPTHPLLVHAPVILVPLLAVVAVGYVLVPWVRRTCTVALVALALLAPLSTVAAKLSGEAFRQRLVPAGRLPAPLASQVDHHAELADALLIWVLALAVGTLLAVFGGVFQRSGSRLSGVSRAVLALVVVGLAATTLWYCVQTGHSGATMVWRGS